MKNLRFIIFAVMHAFLVFAVVAYTIEFFGIGFSYFDYTDSDLSIDGSSVPKEIPNLFIFLTNGILGVFIGGAYVVITALLSVAMLLPLYFISIKPTTVIDESEATTTKKILLWSWLGAYILCAVLTMGQSLLYVPLINAVPVFLEFLYLKKLQKAVPKQDDPAEIVIDNTENIK